MIGKHIANPKGHSSFAGLNDYITGKAKRTTEEKISFTDCVNLASIETATMEMESLAFQNKRCNDPVMHLLLSWRENENPTRGQVREAVEVALKELNLSECQAVYALHQNTDNMHLHICVNRVHPETHKAINPAHGWTRRGMEKAARKIEFLHGWQVENNTWTEIDQQGKVVNKPLSPDAVKIPQKSKDMENLTGEQSAIRKAQEVLKKDNSLKNVTDWETFHDLLQRSGLKYQKKGSGAIIVVGEIIVKASAVLRTLGLTQLEKRFGAYQERKSIEKHVAEVNIIREKRPLDVVNDNPLWETYIQERSKYSQERKLFREEQSRAHQEEKQILKDRQRSERKALFEYLKKSGASRREFGQQRSLLATKHAYEIVTLKEAHKEQRQKRGKSQFPSYEDWLKGQNFFLEAEAWRHRKNTKAYLQLSPSDEKLNYDRKIISNLSNFIMTKTKYDVRFSRRDKPGTAAFIASGNRIRVYDVRDDSLLAALRLAQQQWGRIRVNGSEAYKKRCMELAVDYGIQIVNPELQDLRRELERKRVQSQNETKTHPVEPLKRKSEVEGLPIAESGAHTNQKGKTTHEAPVAVYERDKQLEAERKITQDVFSDVKALTESKVQETSDWLKERKAALEEKERRETLNARIAELDRSLEKHEQYLVESSGFSGLPDDAREVIRLEQERSGIDMLEAMKLHPAAAAVLEREEEAEKEALKQLEPEEPEEIIEI
jgi:hypothetical protein